MHQPTAAAIQRVIESLNHPLYGSGATSQAMEWLELNLLTADERQRIEEALAQL